jgi:Rrf2 family protein
MTTPQIADGTYVPASYLSKVLQALGRSGIVRSQRGLHGGFTLARSPDRLNVLEVINAVDPFKRIRECPLGLEAHGTRLCPLHRRLDEAMSLVEATFRAHTIQDLLTEPAVSTPLGIARTCPGPVPAATSGVTRDED